MIDCALVIGKTQGMEAAMSRVHSACRAVHSFKSVDEFFAGNPPSAPLILVCQHWSDEFTPDEISRLLAEFPLSRIVVCQGPWCASDGRTRRFWPAAVCVPLDQVVDRLEKELAVIAGCRAPLPWTAGLDEIFAFDHGVAGVDLP